MKTFYFELKSRHYELDINRHVNNTNYYRYLEEARVQMMLELGLDISIIHNSPVDMVIYKYNVLFKDQVLHGEELVIESTQIQSNKIRGIIRQNIFRKSNHKLVFSADGYWAYIAKNEAGKTLAINYTKKFAPVIDTEIKPIENEKIADWHSGLRNVHEIEMESRPYEMDSFQHMNNAVYSSYYEVARWSFFRNIFDWRIFRQEGGMIVLYKATLEFLKPILPFEKIIVRTWLAELSKTRYSFIQEMISPDKLQIKSRCKTGSCIVGSKGLPIKIPNNIYNFLDSAKSGE